MRHEALDEGGSVKRSLDLLEFLRTDSELSEDFVVERRSYLTSAMNFFGMVTALPSL